MTRSNVNIDLVPHQVSSLHVCTCMVGINKPMTAVVCIQTCYAEGWHKRDFCFLYFSWESLSAVSL